MNIIVIGGGGREHALIQKIKENKGVLSIYALPGNGGIAKDAVCVPIAATDIDGIVSFAKSHLIDFAVVAPDDPLALGAVDRLREAGIPCFGPDKKAAQIESSKIFAKRLMKKYSIPTARFESFEDEEKALAYLKDQRFPVVVKADGLALGKGVVIANTLPEAEGAVRAMMSGQAFGESGKRVVIEEYLEGPEVSVLAFTDGKTICPMISSMDHKRALNGDQGLNTGGMGAIAPNPFYTDEIARRAMKEILLPTMNAMNAEGRTFKGCLYFGLMLTKDGPKVIEYNCRFGDPEAQAVLPLLETDLLTIMMAVEEERLSDIQIKWSEGASCCVMVVSGGYPGKYKKGLPIDMGKAEKFANIYSSGTSLGADGTLYTAGGRVLGAAATGKTLKEAIEKATHAADEIRFEGAYRRSDIGARALREGK